LAQCHSGRGPGAICSDPTVSQFCPVGKGVVPEVCRMQSAETRQFLNEASVTSAKMYAHHVNNVFSHLQALVGSVTIRSPDIRLIYYPRTWICCVPDQVIFLRVPSGSPSGHRRFHPGHLQNHVESARVTSTKIYENHQIKAF